MGLVAIIMAISLSAFTAPKGKLAKKNKKGSWDLWWYQVKPGYGISSVFTNDIVDFITVSPYMPEYICTEFPWTYKCTIGFDPIDVDTDTNLLLPGNRIPVAIGEMRPDY